MPKNAFRLEQQGYANRALSDAEVDRLFRDFVSKVSAVQVEQMAVLRMFRRHGVREVFSEGYAVAEEAAFEEMVETLPLSISRLPNCKRNWTRFANS